MIAVVKDLLIYVVVIVTAVMSVACANIVSRNIFREFVNPSATDAQEARVARLASLLVKAGALVFIILVPAPYIVPLGIGVCPELFSTAIPAVGSSFITRPYPNLVLDGVAPLQAEPRPARLDPNGQFRSRSIARWNISGEIKPNGDLEVSAGSLLRKLEIGPSASCHTSVDDKIVAIHVVAFITCEK